MAKRLDESIYKLGMQVGLGPPRPHCVRWGQLAPKRGTAPQFSAHVRCGQTAGWIKMPLGMEVGLGPGDFVLDGDAAPPKKGHSPRIFGPCLLSLNGWLNQDGTWYGGRPRPRRLCVRCGVSSLPQRSTSPFLAHVYCGQTFAHLSYC